MAREGLSAVWSADRLDTRLRQGRLGADHLRAVARELARFHAAARRDGEVACHGTRDAMAHRVRESYTALRRVWPAGLDSARLAEIEAQQLELVDVLSDRIELRLESGRVREVHGSLRLEGVYVDAASRTAWSPPGGGLAARAADVCADVASLSRQLALHGRRDVAERWIAAYADAAQDYGIYPVLDLYEGLASCALAEEIARGFAAHIDAADAGRLLRAALIADLATPPARILVVGGPAATGKSTLAERMAAGMRAPVVAATRARDLHEVIGSVEAVLDSRRPVVVDGGFGLRAERAALRAIASARGVPFLFVECRADAALLRRRLHGRIATDTAGPACESPEPWEAVDDLPREAHLVIDTAKHPEGNAAAIRQVLGPPRVVTPVRHPRSAHISAT